MARGIVGTTGPQKPAFCEFFGIDARLRVDIIGGCSFLEMSSTVCPEGSVMSPKSIFLDFNLPNATTWFYFSLLLAIALFVKFSRLLSMRNWDVLTLFLLVPGLLILQQAHGAETLSEKWLWSGYLWLFCGSLYFFVRCLLDLTLVRRPALNPNLNFAGLAWLGAVLAVCLLSRSPCGNNRGRRWDRLSASISRCRGPGDAGRRRRYARKSFRSWPTIRKPGRRCGRPLCHLTILAGLVTIGYRHFQNPHAGMAAATFYLLLPYTAIHIGQVHHVWPITLIVWAVVAYRFPTVAGLLLGLAAGAPTSRYWRSRSGRASIAVGGAVGSVWRLSCRRRLPWRSPAHCSGCKAT